jgi:hypothetical protein
MKRLMATILVAVLVLVLLTLAALAKPNMDKPLSATNVGLVKKVTLRGRPGGGCKPVRRVGTGVLGRPRSRDKYAILVGISDYPGEENDLEYGNDDAQDVNNALTTLYGYISDNIHRLTLWMPASLRLRMLLTISGRRQWPATRSFSSSVGKAPTVWQTMAIRKRSMRQLLVMMAILAGGMTDLQAPGRTINMGCSENRVPYENDSW